MSLPLPNTFYNSVHLEVIAALCYSNVPSADDRKAVPPLPYSCNVQNELEIQNNKLNKYSKPRFIRIRLIRVFAKTG